jgi:hypothetical protein
VLIERELDVTSSNGKDKEEDNNEDEKGEEKA